MGFFFTFCASTIKAKTGDKPSPAKGSSDRASGDVVKKSPADDYEEGLSN
tara:strand:- start:305 stop:454 length:150 start_codon:yes stop_codon:yes gene_type:complete